MNEEKKPSRRHRVEKAAPAVPWWLQQVRERPLTTAGTLVSVVGGLILLVFFCQLGEAPDLDLVSFGAVPMAIALVGFTLAAALTGCAFFAGLALRGTQKRVQELSPGWTAMLLCTPGIVGVLALVIYLAIEPKGKLPTWSMWSPAALTLLLSLGVTIFLKRPLAEGTRGAKARWAKFERFWELIGFGLLWVLVAYLALFVFWVLFPRERSSTEFLLGLLMWTLCCYSLNLMVAWAPRNVFILLLMSIGLGLTGLLASTGNWSGFPRAAVSVLGLGDVPVKMVVTKDGCDYLNKTTGGRLVCRSEPDEKTAVVCPAILRSRIGSPYFVGLSAYEDDGRWPQAHPPRRLEAIAIPKSAVPSWTQLSRATAKAPVTAASGAIVTYLDAQDQGEWLREQCGSSPDLPAPTHRPTPGRSQP